MANTRWGRVGDSHIIGAGTYADNDSCAVSANGHGEYFIRHVAAYSICSLVRIKGLSLAEAADEVVNNRSEEHTSELQSRGHLVCRLLLEKIKFVINPSCDIISIHVK